VKAKTFKQAVDFLKDYYGLRLREDKARRWTNGREYNLLTPTGKVVVGINLYTGSDGFVHIGGKSWILETPKELS
jgi:hypothetical protein